MHHAQHLITRFLSLNTQFGNGCNATGDVVVRFDRNIDGETNQPAPDAAAVRSHVTGGGGAPAFVELSESHFSCMDGRYTEGVVSTAGGDAGEFIVALTVAASYEAAVASQDVVNALLADYLRYCCV